MNRRTRDESPYLRAIDRSPIFGDNLATQRYQYRPAAQRDSLEHRPPGLGVDHLRRHTPFSLNVDQYQITIEVAADIALEMSDAEVDLVCERFSGLLQATGGEKTQIMERYAGGNNALAHLAWLRKVPQNIRHITGL